jgi:hypothetical protein
MKKQLLLLLTILSVGIAGCSKDDKKPSENTSDITGRWYATEVEVDNRWKPVKGTCLDGMYAEFSKELTYKSYDSCIDDSYYRTYARSGDLVTCKVGDAIVTYRIIELSGNNSTLELTEGGESIKMKAVSR